MRHLGPEEIVSYAYREGSSRWVGAVEKHLSSCPMCAEAIAEFSDGAQSLAAALESVPGVVNPQELSAQIGQTVMQTVTAETHAEARTWSRVHLLKNLAGWQTRLLVFSTCCLLVAGLSFFAGRVWEQKHKTRQSLQASPQKEPVVLVVLGNHLERSERLLVALNHPEDADAQSEELQTEARALLDENHTCLQQVPRNDPALLGVLQQLDTLLHGMASPDLTTSSSFRQFDYQEDTNNLLFEIRVLRERVSGSRTDTSNTLKGGTI